MVDTDAWFPANSEPVKDVNTKQTSGLWLIQYTVYSTYYHKVHICWCNISHLLFICIYWIVSWLKLALANEYELNILHPNTLSIIFLESWEIE